MPWLVQRTVRRVARGDGIWPKESGQALPKMQKPELDLHQAWEDRWMGLSADVLIVGE